MNSNGDDDDTSKGCDNSFCTSNLLYPSDNKEDTIDMITNHDDDDDDNDDHDDDDRNARSYRENYKINLSIFKRIDAESNKRNFEDQKLKKSFKGESHLNSQQILTKEQTMHNSSVKEISNFHTNKGHNLQQSFYETVRMNPLMKSFPIVFNPKSCPGIDSINKDMEEDEMEDSLEQQDSQLESSVGHLNFFHVNYRQIKHNPSYLSDDEKDEDDNLNNTYRHTSSNPSSMSSNGIAGSNLNLESRLSFNSDQSSDVSCANKSWMLGADGGTQCSDRYLCDIRLINNNNSLVNKNDRNSNKDNKVANINNTNSNGNNNIANTTSPIIDTIIKPEHKSDKSYNDYSPKSLKGSILQKEIPTTTQACSSIKGTFLSTSTTSYVSSLQENKPAFPELSTSDRVANNQVGRYSTSKEKFKDQSSNNDQGSEVNRVEKGEIIVREKETLTNIRLKARSSMIFKRREMLKSKAEEIAEELRQKESNEIPGDKLGDIRKTLENLNIPPTNISSIFSLVRSKSSSDGIKQTVKVERKELEIRLVEEQIPKIFDNKNGDDHEVNNESNIIFTCDQPKLGSFTKEFTEIFLNGANQFDLHIEINNIVCCETISTKNEISNPASSEENNSQLPAFPDGNTFQPELNELFCHKTESSSSPHMPADTFKLTRVLLIKTTTIDMNSTPERKQTFYELSKLFATEEERTSNERNQSEEGNARINTPTHVEETGKKKLNGTQSAILCHKLEILSNIEDTIGTL